MKGLLPDVSLQSPWWIGPNVCTDRKEIDEGVPKNRSFTFYFETASCKETDLSYTCTRKIENNDEKKTFVDKKQCCYGYKPQGSKCVKYELKGLIDVMKDLKATRFIDMLSSVNLLNRLENENFTVFCPPDDAVEESDLDGNDNSIPNGRIVRATDVDTTVAGHLVEGYITSEDFESNQILTSANGKTGIRLNIYSGLGQKPLVLPNCAKITSINNYATNGVVHLIDRMLPIPTKTVLEIIASNSQLTILKGLLSQADMVEKLRDPEETFTVFAPVDSAFKQISNELLKKWQKGEGCVTSIVKNHISPHVICSSAIINVGYVSNLLSKELKIKRDENDKLFVNDIQIVGYDIVGTNGVVHIIEEVLIPDEAKTLTQTLQSSGRSDLVDLIEIAGIKDDLDSMKNFTFFAPSKNSLKKLLSNKSTEFSEDPEKNKELILSHIAITAVKPCEFHNNQLLPSIMEDSTFRINRYDVIPGFAHHFTLQCVPLVNVNHGVCEGAIHVVYNTISPSKNKIVETLENMEGVSTFLRLLKESGLADTLEEEGPFTVLAPDDVAFDNMKDKSILEDKEQLEKFLKLHILSETMCCAGIRTNVGFYVRQFVTTLNGTEIPVQRNHRGVKFSSSKVTECDHMAKNGVIHVISKIIHPPKSYALDFSDIIREMFII